MAKAPGQNTGERRHRTPRDGSPAPQHAPISPARMAAFEILERVVNTDAHSDDLLHSARLTPLSQPDRNLATALVLGVLRWQIALDADIRPMLARPDMVVPGAVLTALRLGAFQLRHMERIPAHAALSESVELVRSAGQPQAAGMVNALLRRMTRSAPARVPLVESTASLAQRMSHPAWLVSRWENNYGRNAAAAICAFNQKPPQENDLFIPDGGLPQMDAGSRLVAELAAAAAEKPARIWDCCAAPGGKTLVLAQRHPVAELLATDVSPRRVRVLQERLKPFVARVRTQIADVTAMADDANHFDLILCDVPCTGTGTLGRNPELKLRISPPDLLRQAARQRAILRAALGRLAPGGSLLYSTCSLEPEENEQVIAEVLAGLREGPRVRQESLGPVMDRLNSIGVIASGAYTSAVLHDGCLRTLPGVNLRADGFFAALFVRT